MRQLIRTPGSYLTGFLKGFFGTIAVCVLPLAGLLFEARRTPPAHIIGLLLVVLLVAAVIVGGLIGYGLDRWLGTTPWLFLLFFVLAIGAVYHRVPWAHKAAAAPTRLGFFHSCLPSFFHSCLPSTYVLV